MAKLTLTDITSLANTASAKQALNDNFTALETAIENTLSRNGLVPNQMSADIDLNDNDLLNVGRIDANELFKNGVPFEQTVAYSSKNFQLLSGTGAQTSFTLTEDPGSLGNLYVSIAGLDQKPGIDYNYNGTTLTFVAAPASGTNNIYVRYDKALPTGVTVASAITFLAAPAGAVARSIESKDRDFISVKDFGAKGDGTTDDTAAVQTAITAISESQSRRGATLYFPRGHYKLTDTLTLTSYVTDNAINIALVGEGWLSTWLDFSSMTGAKDGIYVPNDQQVTIRGFYVKGSNNANTRDGIRFGSTAGGSNAVSIFDISDVRVQAWGRDGVSHYNSYMGAMTRVYAIANLRDGFRMDGFHTSLTFRNCYARSNTAGAGFRVNGMVYSHFEGCASDVNSYGFVLSNVRSTKFSGCGAEGNNLDGWFAFADNTGAPTSNPLFVSECYDVRGLTLDNCAGYGNNIASAGHGGLLRTSATGVHTGAGTYGDSSPHKVFVSVNDCDANVSVPGTKGIVTALSSGGVTEVILDGDNFFPGGFTKGAGTRIRNKSLEGRKCKLTLSADVTIADATATTVSWTTAGDEIGGCWAGGSPTLLTVPAGVSRIRLTASTGWVNNAAGSRRFMVQTGAGAQANGYPRDDRAAAGNFNTTAMGASDVFDVTPGDQFRMQVEQTSGGNLDLRSNTSFLTMEIIE